MMIVSPAIGLNIWSSTSDPYSSEQLANNFLKLDQADHSPGRGIQIPTAGLRDQAVTTPKIANGAVTAAQLAAGVATPTGQIIMFGASTAPTGFLLCDGSAVSRSTYFALFALLGSNFGNGDGVTTFNLPNFTDRMPIAAGNTYTLGETGGNAATTLTQSNLPSHTHQLPNLTHTHTVNDPTHDHGFGGGTVAIIGPGSTSAASGASTGTITQTSNASTGITLQNALAGDLNTSSVGGNGAFTNLPPFLGIYFMIKT